MANIESTDLDSGWASAISDEYGLEVKSTKDPAPTPPVVDEEEEEEEKTPAVAPVEGEEDDTAEEDDKSDDASDDSGESGEDDTPVEEDAGTGDEKPVDAPKEDAVELSPKEAMKEALRELGREEQDRVTSQKAIKKEVLDTLYPEGLDRSLRDSDGDPITGIDDLTKLINPKTNELFTEEEAGAWLLASQKELNTTIEQIEQYVEGVAEAHLTLKESAEYVEHKWGDVIKAFPEEAKKVFEAYGRTLVKDKKTGIVIKAPVDMADFYDISLAGYAKLSESMAQKKSADAAAAEKAVKEAQKAEKDDRSDIGAGGDTKTPLPKETQDWASAYKDYYEL